MSSPSRAADATLCVALLMALVAGALMLTMRGSLIGRHLVAVYCQSTDAGRQRCEAPVLVGLMPNSTVSWSVKASTGLTLNASSWTTHEVQTALDLRHCSLRRFTQAEAQQCLAGRPIVAIGDSLTRYQYLSLVNFLDTGVWRDTASTTRSRNLTYLHAGHHDYGPYYAALSGPQYFGDRMSCDCYRTRTKFIAENHFYKGSCGVSASFYYYSGYPKPPMIEQLQGHFGFPPFSNKTQCTPGECNAPADWSMSLEEALQRVIPLLKPAILLINFGLWRRATETPWSAERFDAIMRAANNAVKPRNGQVIWKTTTATKSGNVDRHWDDDAVAAANRHGASVLDTWALTKPLSSMTPSPFVDNGHYTPPVYAELNNVLLNLLC